MIRVGLVGTGYAAQRRADAIATSSRSHLVAITGHSCDRTQSLCQDYQAEWVPSANELVQRSDLDLVIIATVNAAHGAIAEAALRAQKHVVVEYPLALELSEAQQLLSLSRQQQRLLHVEHIELLSGIHQAVLDGLPHIGIPFYVQSVSLRASSPPPAAWSYDPAQVGFPLIAALSRIQRLVRLFGRVQSVSCQSRFWLQNGSIEETPAIATPFQACLCSAQLRFASGLLADLVYGKGTAIGKTERFVDIHGQSGLLRVEGNQGWLVQQGESQPLSVGSRKGLFAKDTDYVLDTLLEGKPLYIQPEESLYALAVADAARRSALIGTSISLEELPFLTL